MILQACSKCGCNGVAHHNAKSFMKNMLKLAKENDRLKQEQRKRISCALNKMEMKRKDTCENRKFLLCAEGQHYPCKKCIPVFRDKRIIKEEFE